MVTGRGRWFYEGERGGCELEDDGVIRERAVVSEAERDGGDLGVSVKLLQGEGGG